MKKKATGPFDPEFLADMTHLFSDGEQSIILDPKIDTFLCAQILIAAANRLRNITEVPHDLMDTDPELEEIIILESAALRVLGNRCLIRLMHFKRQADLKATASSN